MNSLNVFPTPGTRHYTLLNTNEPPEDSERMFIDSVISKTEARLVWLDDEIPKLREKLKQLEDERASMPRHLTRNKAVLAPLRRMPPEVHWRNFLVDVALHRRSLECRQDRYGAEPMAVYPDR
jgi:hypothetical protein